MELLHGRLYDRKRSSPKTGLDRLCRSGRARQDVLGYEERRNSIHSDESRGSSRQASVISIGTLSTEPSFEHSTLSTESSFESASSPSTLDDVTGDNLKRQSKSGISRKRSIVEVDGHEKDITAPPQQKDSVGSISGAQATPDRRLTPPRLVRSSSPKRRKSHAEQGNARADRKGSLSLFHDLHDCYDKGSEDSPTYDKAGFELDYNKPEDWIMPKNVPKAGVPKRTIKDMEQTRMQEQRMSDIIFEPGAALNMEDDKLLNGTADHFKDRVSKDLNVPWHKVTMEHFEEWDKKDFPRAKKGEYEEFTEDEKDRMTRLM